VTGLGSCSAVGKKDTEPKPTHAPQPSRCLKDPCTECSAGIAIITLSFTTLLQLINSLLTSCEKPDSGPEKPLVLIPLHKRSTGLQIRKIRLKGQEERALYNALLTDGQGTLTGQGENDEAREQHALPRAVGCASLVYERGGKERNRQDEGKP